MNEEINIDRNQIAKLSIEIQKDLAKSMVNAYLRGEFTMVQLLANTRYYGLEGFVDWDSLSKPNHLIGNEG